MRHASCACPVAGGHRGKDRVPDARRRAAAAVRDRDTWREIATRRVLSVMYSCYRRHRRDLSGRPPLAVSCARSCPLALPPIHAGPGSVLRPGRPAPEPSGMAVASLAFGRGNGRAAASQWTVRPRIGWLTAY